MLDLTEEDLGMLAPEEREMLEAFARRSEQNDVEYAMIRWMVREVCRLRARVVSLSRVEFPNL